MFGSITNHSSFKRMKNRQIFDNYQAVDGSRQGGLQYKDKIDHVGSVPEEDALAKKSNKIKASLVQCFHKAKKVFKGTSSEPTEESCLARVANRRPPSPSIGTTNSSMFSLESHLFTVARITLSHRIVSRILFNRPQTLALSTPRKKSDYACLIARKLARLKCLSEFKKRTPTRRFSRAHRLAVQGHQT